MDAIAFVNEHAPWLAAPELGVCVVGSQALATACRGANIPGPNPSDLDLAWALSPEQGQAVLERHGCFAPTTPGNLERGTLAAKLGGQRIEITTFRAGDQGAPLTEQVKADLSERDMTIGAVAIQLSNNAVHDPFGGLQHYQEQLVAPVGDPIDRVREHGIRWLRYFRKAYELGFRLDPSIRALGKQLDPSLLLEQPKEAVALELRAILCKTQSPGRCLHDLHEAGVLSVISESLARQFDGRPAGPQRWHPEVGQGLHLILAMEWVVAHATNLAERDRAAALFAVLCHDLGKSDTHPEDFPHHRGHEQAGAAHVEALCSRWPGLMDQRAATLCKHVASLHLDVRRFDELRDGTLAKLYENFFRAKDYPLDAFAIAVAADSAGRLGHAADGAPVRDRVLRDLTLLRHACGEVDAGALRQQFPDDLDAFRAALHAARARAIKAARSAGGVTPPKP